MTNNAQLSRVSGVQHEKRARVKKLMSYVPKCLIDQMLELNCIWDPTRRMPCKSFWAVNVFIDISNFSGFASDLRKSEEGERNGAFSWVTRRLIFTC